MKVGEGAGMVGWSGEAGVGGEVDGGSIHAWRMVRHSSRGDGPDPTASGWSLSGRN